VYWFEALECARRLILTGMLVFIMPGTAGQNATACVLAFATLLVYGLMHPHSDKTDSISYTLGAAVIFVTMFIALLMQSEYTDAQSEHVISVLLIVLNVVVVVLALAQGSHTRKQMSSVVETFARPSFKAPAV
jgi:hypothetical protein